MKTRYPNGESMKSARKISTRLQILLAGLVIGLIPAVFMVLQSLHCAREAVMKAQRRELILLLNQHRIRIEEWRNSRNADMQTLAMCPSIRSLVVTPSPTPEQRKDVESFIQSFRRDNPYFVGIGVYKSDGSVIVKDATEHALDSEMFKDIVGQIHNSKATTWSRKYHSHTAEKKIGMHIGCQIRIDGAPKGYIVAALYLDSLIYDLGKGAGIDTTTTLSLIDLRNKCYLTGGRRFSPASTVPTALFAAPESRLYEYVGSEGKTVFGIGLDLEDFNWLLLAEIEKNEALWVVGFLLRRALMTLGIVIPIIAIAAMLSARKLAMPFRRLMAVCRTVSDGNAAIRVEPFVTQEANEVADAFNLMLDRLDETHRQLVQAGALAAVGELSASIVHEMRNPLNTIQMNLEALKPTDESDNRRRELFELAKSQTTRLQEMLNELLNFGAPIELKKEMVDLTKLAKEAAASVITTDAADVETLVDGPPIRLHVDKELLFRAISNLVENAVQFTQEDGLIKVTTQSNDGRATIIVEDNGPGVPASMRDKIFRPFFTNRDGGTGLGLANVRKIVELHGGELDLQETPLGGAAFSITLPQGSQHGEHSDY